MSHSSQINFFKTVIPLFGQFFHGKVIDIGSLDINGGPHTLLQAEEYVGVDLGPGPNVTLVSPGEKVSLASDYFDVAMSSECFEHNPKWRETLLNMIRMVKPGGVVAFSCATTGRAEHGTSRSDGGKAAPLAIEIGQEYYENVTREDVAQVVSNSDLTEWFIEVEPIQHDLYFVGLKKRPTPESIAKFRMAKRSVKNRFRHGFVKGPALRRLCFRFAGDRGLSIFDAAKKKVDFLYGRIFRKK